MPDENPTSELEPAPATSTSEPGEESVTDSSDSPAPTVDELQAALEREKAGRAGAQREMESMRSRLAQTESMQQQLLQQMQNNQNVPTAQPEPEYPSGLSPEEQKELQNAYIDGDVGKAQQLEATKFERQARRLENRFTAKQTEQQTLQQKNQSFVAYLSSNADALDPNKPVGQKVIERYQVLLNDPNLSFVDRTPFRLANGQTVIPGVLMKAIDEARLATGQSQAAAVETQRQSADEFVEPSRPSGEAPGGRRNMGFNPAVHLNDAEKAFVADRQKVDPTYTAKRYWEAYQKSKPEEAKQRLSSGRAEQLGKPGSRYSFSM